MMMFDDEYEEYLIIFLFNLKKKTMLEKEEKQRNIHYVTRAIGRWHLRAAFEYEYGTSTTVQQ